VIYSPDYGAAYANPLYHLQRDLKRIEVRCPIAFTHGDLNLRNVLLARTSDGGIAGARPVFIDFRHASDEQWAIVDLAKLEACLRYTRLHVRDDYGFLRQVAEFLSS